MLCILEAKREDIDPYEAKEQARGYAENLKAPFILLSNGSEHWFWNYERADQRDAFRVERMPSREDLERLRLKNLQPPRPLQSELVKPDYLRHLKHDLTLRRYQISAMDEIARLFDTKGKRQFLLEMATGTGKTLLCAALIRRFLTTRNAERVLFVVDRWITWGAISIGASPPFSANSSRSFSRARGAQANCWALRLSSPQYNR